MEHLITSPQIGSLAVLIIGLIVSGIASLSTQDTEEVSESLQDHVNDLSTHIGWRSDSLNDHLMMITSLRNQMESYPNISWALDIEIKRLRNMGAKLPWDRKESI